MYYSGAHTEDRQNLFICMCFFLYNFFQFLVYINLILDAIYSKLVKKIEQNYQKSLTLKNRSPPRHNND